MYDYDAIRIHALGLSSYISDVFTIRYAMKANSNSEILRIMCDAGIWIDCCSEYEVDIALDHGFFPHTLQISSQQWPRDRRKFNERGISCVVTSLHQLEQFGQQCPGTEVWVRINPGQWSGQFARINTGGVDSSFWIRHEYIHDIQRMSLKYNLTINKLHIHIWSWSDTQVWLDTLHFCLKFLSLFPSVCILNMWWWFKVWRMPWEKTTDLDSIISQSLDIIHKRSVTLWRKLSLEIEPGTYLIAPFGYILCYADDIVDTWPQGYQFVRTTTGMDMILRPTMYAAQHPIYHYSYTTKQRSSDWDHRYVFVWHCCESSDLLTPDPSDAEKISTRWFNQQVAIWDMIVIGWAWAYCESMRCRWYNGYQ